MSKMKYQILAEGKLKDVSSSEIRNNTAPYYLFIGGLLHVNGLQLGGGLLGLLKTMVGENKNTPIYIASFDVDEPNVGHTADQMHEYHQTRLVTDEAISLVHDLFAPENSDVEAFNQYCANIHLIGYSYGTSLIQQMESYLRDVLVNNDEGLDALEKVSSVCIGPVITPNLTLKNGEEVVYGSEESGVPDADHIDTTGRFRQTFIFREDDKVMQEVVKRDLTAPIAEGALVSQSYANITFICDRSGDDMVRRIGIDKFASGVKTPRVDFNMDYEGHGLRLYTNTLMCNAEDGVGFVTFPSCSLGRIIKDKIQFMVLSQDDHHVFSVNNPPKDFLSDEARETETLIEAFDACLGQFRRNLHQDNFVFVEGIIATVDKAENVIMARKDLSGQLKLANG
jgi:hypothetical protein